MVTAAVMLATFLAALDIIGPALGGLIVDYLDGAGSFM
jgi:hypothetical protein